MYISFITLDSFMLITIDTYMNGNTDWEMTNRNGGSLHRFIDIIINFITRLSEATFAMPASKPVPTDQEDAYCGPLRSSASVCA